MQAGSSGKNAQNFEKVNSKSGAFKKIGLLAPDVKRQGRRFFYRRAFFSTVAQGRGLSGPEVISQSSAKTRTFDSVYTFLKETGILPLARAGGDGVGKRMKEARCLRKSSLTQIQALATPWRFSLLWWTHRWR
ncbi:MAG: hypothetical protein GY758_16970 [Fuerstiella sp.]|nr:hypothetical protein [Fuerstiella sp.]